jgi:hypothetical protein
MPNSPQTDSTTSQEKTSTKTVKELTTSNYLMLVGAIVETILAIPIIGGLLVTSTAWLVLIATLTLHIVSLVYTIQEKNWLAGPITGIIASVIGFIPILAILVHIIAAILNWVGAFRKTRE